MNNKLLCILLFFSSAMFTFAQNSENENTLVKNGQTFLQNGEFAKAIAEFDKVIKINSKNVAAFYLRGNAKFFIQDIDGAIFDFSKVIEIAPKIKDIEKVYNFRANSYFLKKDNEKSFTDYEKAILINPNYPEPYNGRANIYYSRGEYAKSLSDYNKIIELDPKATAAYIGRADIRFDRGELDSALSDLDKSLDLTPNVAGSHIKRGIIYGLKDNWLLSVTDLRKGAEINAKSRSPYWGNLQTTLSDFDKYVSSNSKNANAYAVRGFINLLRGKYEESEIDFKRSFEINPKLENDLNNFIKTVKETKQ